MTLVLEPLPKDGAAWHCAAGLQYGYRLWIEHVPCEQPAVGLLPADIAKTFGVMRAVCEEHRQFIEDELVD